MSSHSDQARTPTDPAVPPSIWMRRLFIALTIIAWVIIGCFLFFVIWLFGESFTLLLIGGLLAYIVQQLAALVRFVTQLLSPEGQQRIRPFLDALQKIGLSKEQFTGFGEQFLAQLHGVFLSAFPFVGGIFSWIILVFTIATLSVYFLLDGARVISWLRMRTPLKYRDMIGFLLSTADRAAGGYFRGLLLLAIVAGIGAGVVLQVVGNPFSVLLGVLSFALFFIPIIGGFVSRVLCILFALPQGWETALIVGISIITLQVVILGLILEPRIFHRTVGVHPILVIFAIFAGLERFGILDVLLAVPITGLVQEMLIAYWKRYQTKHSDQFPSEVPPSAQPELVEEELTKVVSEN